MSFAAIAIGAAGAQVLGGAAQTIFSGKRKAQREMEKLASSSPTYSGSKPISDYYNEALNRYNVSPYQSNQYQMAMQNAQRSTATGLNALQGRGGALSGVGKLIGLQNEAMNRAGVNAEQERNQRFGQLGGATSMKSADDMRKFQINQLDPYNRKLNLSQMKTSAANARFDAGLSNIFGGLSNASMLLSGRKKTTQQPFDVTNSLDVESFMRSRPKINSN